MSVKAAGCRPGLEYATDRLTPSAGVERQVPVSLVPATQRMAFRAAKRSRLPKSPQRSRESKNSRPIVPLI